MTTVPGHNQVLQQSGLAQEFSHQAQAPKPGPDQAATIQQAQQVVENTTVQNSENSERLKEKKKRELALRAKKARMKEKEAREEELALNPDARGRLVDTRA